MDDPKTSLHPRQYLRQVRNAGTFNRFRRFVFSNLWNRMSKQLPDLTPIGVVAIAALCTTSLLVGVRSLGALQRWELLVFDWMIRLRPDDPPDPRLLVVGITEDDLSRFGWPLSDRTLAQALNQLQQHDPAAIGLDLYRNLSQPPGYEELVAELNAPNLIGIENDNVDPPPTLPEARIGFNDLVSDPDGPIRRNLMTFEIEGKTRYSFSLRLALHYLQLKGLAPEVSPTGAIVWGKAVFEPLTSTSGGYATIDAKGYQILLNYRAEDRAVETVTLSQVLDRQVPPEWIEDKIIAIGTIAPSIGDVHYTPYSSTSSHPFMAGVVIHAQMLSQLLSAVIDGRPLFWFWSEGVEIAWILAWTVGGAAIAWWCRHPLLLVAVSAGGIGVLVLTTWGIFLAAGWIPFVTPVLGWAIAGSGVVAYRAYQSGRQQQIVMKLLGQSTSPEVADALWSSRDHLLKNGKLPGQKLVATMLFTDLKDFSTISEQMPPEALLEWLNEYLEMLTEVVQEHHGIINKFTGDGIMAAFGVPIARQQPEEIAEDAYNAVSCGLTMSDRLQILNREWQQRGLPVIQMRVGIYTGPIVAGSLGGKERLEYGMIGDSVNIASRLESCEKDRQSSICRVLIARETLTLIREQFVVEHWGPLALKGKHQMVDVYRVLARQQKTGEVPVEPPVDFPQPKR
ncbi:CHASE2 domain-containing protein [Oxynema aestuarii]|nr:adenylate/guanylate cyclase domain-containing protein [Oxynema aestuarii]